MNARQASPTANPTAILPDSPGADVAGWYRQYHQRLLDYLRGNLRTESDAQDVSQEVFLRLLRVPDERVIEHPRAYLFRVAANVVSDWRAGQKMLQAPLEDPDSLPAAESTDDDYDRQKRHEQIRQVVATLPVHQRTALLLSTQHGMTYKQIAETLDVSERAVKRYIVKAYASLRRDLSELAMDSAPT